MLNNNDIDIDDTLANTKTTGVYAGVFSKYDLESELNEVNEYILKYDLTSKVKQRKKNDNNRNR